MDLHNSSYDTQPHSLIVNQLHLKKKTFFHNDLPKHSLCGFSPVKPDWHLQVNEPLVLTQSEFGGHLFLLLSHSFISLNETNYNLQRLMGMKQKDQTKALAIKRQTDKTVTCLPELPLVQIETTRIRWVTSDNFFFLFLDNKVTPLASPHFPLIQCYKQFSQRRRINSDKAKQPEFAQVLLCDFSSATGVNFFIIKMLTQLGG